MPTQTQPVTQAPTDPYAEFGGSVTTTPESSPASATTNNADPYAEFGGSVTSNTQDQLQSPLSDPADAMARSEAYKRNAWSGVVNGVHAGDLKTAAHSFLSLFQNPDEAANPADYLSGAVKGAGQTVNAASELVSRILPSVVRPQDVQALKGMETQTTPSEQAGGGLENLAEFMMGEEGVKALEGLSYVQRLSKLMPYMKQLEESPRLLKTIRGAYNVAKMSGVTAGVSAAHPGDGQTRSQAALSGAVAGAALGTAGEAIGALPSWETATNFVKGGQPRLQTAVRGAAQTAADVGAARPSIEVTTADAHPVSIEHDADGNVINADGRHRVLAALERGDATIPVQTKLADGTTATLNQPPQVVAAKMGLGNTIQDVRDSIAATDEQQGAVRAGNDQPRPAETKMVGKQTAGAPALEVQPDASMRTALHDVSDDIQGRGKQIYQALDRVSDNKFTTYTERLKKINDRLSDLIPDTTEADDAAIERLEQQKSEIETSQAQLFENLKESGIDPRIVDDAKAHWRQAMALRDVDQALKMSTTGNTQFGAREIVDPNKFVNRLEKLNVARDGYPSRLEQAIGKEGADALMKDAYAAIKTKQVLKYTKWAGAIMAGAGLVPGTLHNLAQLSGSLVP
jgi:hypothetical protein